MDCDKYLDLIDRYLDNELDYDDSDDLKKHIENCPKCAQDLKERSEINQLFQELPELDLPVGFHQSLMDKIKHIQEETAPKKAFYKNYKQLSFIAAGLLCLLVVTSIGLNSKNYKDTASPALFNGGEMQSAPSSAYEMDTGGTMESISPEESSGASDGYTAFDSSAITYSDSADFYNADIGMYQDQEEDWDQFSMEEPSDDFSQVESGNDVAAPETSRSAVTKEYDSSVITQSRKIIRDASLTLDVDSFDDAIRIIRTYTEQEAGGYVEDYSSTIYSTAYYEGIGQIELKRGLITLKIPAYLYDDALAQISKTGNVVEQQESSVDITSQYMDTEVRYQTKKREETRLLDMIDQADSIEDLIILESRLSEIRHEIETYETNLNNWDRQVQYSTITIYITEYDTLHHTIEPVGLSSRLKEGLQMSLSYTLYGIENTLVRASWNAVPITACIIIILIILLCIIYKKRKRK